MDFKIFQFQILRIYWKFLDLIASEKVPLPRFRSTTADVKSYQQLLRKKLSVTFAI